MFSIFKTPLKYAMTLALLAALTMVYAARVAAEDAVVEFDPGQTKVTFTLADVLHTVHGAFQLKSGTIRYDPASGAASGALVIDARSGNSGSSARDGRMHRNILESQKFPEITFRPLHVKGNVAAQGDSQVEVEGIFNIHGADHALTLPAKLSANNGQMTITTHFVVPYVAWGLKNPSTFILRVSDKVDIDIQASAHLVSGRS